jgi:hypothetical protein
MIRALAIASLLVAAAFSASAQPETSPSARRIYLLCRLEDPICPDLFIPLVKDVIDNPIHRGHHYRCPAFTETNVQAAYTIFMGMMDRGGDVGDTRYMMVLALTCQEVYR